MSGSLWNIPTLYLGIIGVYLIIPPVFVVIPCHTHPNPKYTLKIRFYNRIYNLDMCVIVVEYGDLPFRYQNERCLVVINHQTTADVPTLCAAICKKGVGSGKVCHLFYNYVIDILGHVSDFQMMWVLDNSFRFTNFGLVSWMHGDFFIQQVSIYARSCIPRNMQGFVIS